MRIPFIISGKGTNLGNGKVVIYNLTQGVRISIVSEESSFAYDLRNLGEVTNGDKIKVVYNGKYIGYGSGVVNTSKPGLNLTITEASKSTSLSNITI